MRDSWFSDQPLPLAYTHPTAAKVRESSGVSSATPDKAAIEAYLAAVDVHGAIAGLTEAGRKLGASRGAYVSNLALCFEVMWELVMEILGKGDPVPYERCVLASTGAAPSPSNPTRKRERAAELLASAGYPSASGDQLLAAARVHDDR